MTTTATTTASYRKTSQGEWVVCGSPDIVRPGEVIVTKRDGTTKVEQVARVGRPFTGRDGRETVYGYIARTSGQRECRTGGNCSSFGSGRSCGGHDCDGY